jgi:hypothetical protein
MAERRNRIRKIINETKNTGLFRGIIFVSVLTDIFKPPEKAV